jgi:hypothetical protein
MVTEILNPRSKAAIEAQQHKLLTFTPHHQRDLRACWRSARAVDCGEIVDPTQFVFRCFARSSAFTEPAINVTNAPLASYYDGTFDDFTSTLVFHDRTSFRAAWRVARQLRACGVAFVSRDDLAAIPYFALGHHHGFRLQETAHAARRAA